MKAILRAIEDLAQAAQGRFDCVGEQLAAVRDELALARTEREAQTATLAIIKAELQDDSGEPPSSEFLAKLDTIVSGLENLGK